MLSSEKLCCGSSIEIMNLENKLLLSIFFGIPFKMSG